MNNYTQISMKLAAALLLQRGKISISDIRALPFAENDDTVNFIVESLFSTYRLERYLYHDIANHRWEDVLRLEKSTRRCRYDLQT